MLKSSLCDYSDAYVIVVGTVANDGAGADDNEKRVDEINKGVIFKNCPPFTDWINEINNAQIDHAKDLDVWCKCIIQVKIVIIIQKKQEVCGNITEMLLNNILTDSELFKSKINITEKTPAAGNIKDVNMAVPLIFRELLKCL